MSVYDNVAIGIEVQTRNGNYWDNVSKQKIEIESRRKLLGMEKLPINWENNIITLYDQMEELGTTKNCVIITPITNKWKDTSSKNMDGIGIGKLSLDNLLEF